MGKKKLEKQYLSTDEAFCKVPLHLPENEMEVTERLFTHLASLLAYRIFPPSSNSAVY